jgi:hypothetical protein
MLLSQHMTWPTLLSMFFGGENTPKFCSLPFALETFKENFKQLES